MTTRDKKREFMLAVLLRARVKMAERQRRDQAMPTANRFWFQTLKIIFGRMAGAKK